MEPASCLGGPQLITRLVFSQFEAAFSRVLFESCRFVGLFFGVATTEGTSWVPAGIDWRIECGCDCPFGVFNKIWLGQTEPK